MKPYVHFLGYKCQPVFGLYLMDKSTSLVLYDELGEQVTRASVCVHPEKLEDGEIAIKNWSENLGIEKALIEADIIEDKPVRYINLPSSFVSIPVYRLVNTEL